MSRRLSKTYIAILKLHKDEAKYLNFLRIKDKEAEAKLQKKIKKSSKK